jgi:plastocyanin
MTSTAFARRRFSRLAAVLLGVVVVLVGCSNRTSGVNRRPQAGVTTAAVKSGVQQVTITADDTYRFTPDTITVHPGKVQITLVNKGKGAPHDLSVTGFPADFVPLASTGQTTVAAFTAPAPGRYQFVCTIHVAQGQTGTLVVLPN